MQLSMGKGRTENERVSVEGAHELRNRNENRTS